MASKRLVVFNHKGGVSKTTTAYNLGWMLARNSKVLLVDADPQCNLSSLILGEGFEAYYFDELTKDHNIKNGVAPAFKGQPNPISAVDCVSPHNYPNLFLLAGHADLSEYDGALTFAQTSNNAISTLQNLPGAFSELIRLTEEKYDIDITIIDLNPSLSAINQNLFLSSNAFIVPTNPDPFSIMAINTLKTILPRWVSWKESTASLFADSAYPMYSGTPKFLGTLIQRFNIRNGRAAKPYRDNINEIKQVISSDFFKVLSANNMTLLNESYGQEFIDSHYCLAEIPDFQGTLPKSLAAGKPVFELTDADIAETGPILAQMKQKVANFEDIFSNISHKISSLINNA